jgi:hypothetical protein
MYSIYKIWKDDLCYVGITTDFHKRIIKHKTTCLNQKNPHTNLKVYQVIRVDGWDAWTKEVVETTDDKTRERYWVEKIGNLNVNIPTRSGKESSKNWRDTHKEYLKEQSREFRKKNPDYHTYREEQITCDCGGHYSLYHKSRHFKSNKHLTYINTNG